MTEPEMSLWLDANKSLAWNRGRVKSPCLDCPLSFAIQMRAEGCCDGIPQGVVGRPPLEDTPQRARWRNAQRARTARRRTARIAA